MKNNSVSILHTYVLNGDCKKVEELISKGIDTNVKDCYGNTGMHFAAYFGDIEMLKILVKSNAHLNILNKKGEKPLYLAIKMGHLSVVQFFITLDSSCQYDFDEGNTLCHIAAQYGKSDIIAWAVREKLEIDKENHYRATPLDFAIKASCINTVKILVESHVELNRFDINGQAPIHHAAERSLEILKILWSKGANMYIKDRNDANIIHIAAQYDKIDIIDWIENELCLKMEWLDIDGDSPIHYAAKSGNVRTLEYFFMKGIPMDECNFADESPLFLAAFEGHINVIEYFYEMGFSITECDKDGDYLMHIAAIEGNTRLLDFLLKKSVDIKVKNSCGFTPLELAIAYKNREAIALLKSHLNKQATILGIKYLEDVTSQHLNYPYVSESAKESISQCCDKEIDDIEYRIDEMNVLGETFECQKLDEA